ncbi:MAG TPA: RNA polymerase subunit sigma [Bacillus pumilus]|nr:RNA polymerase subunit sigma [Bacillus pumilus]
MGASTNKPDQHLRYEAQYKLDGPDGVKALLAEYTTLRQRRFLGDMAACDILIDLERAIELAALTGKQYEALRLVYFDDLSQTQAGAALGVRQDVVAQHIAVAVNKIADIYYYWASHGEGYGYTKGAI